jgi:hypothetical protein
MGLELAHEGTIYLLNLISHNLTYVFYRRIRAATHYMSWSPMVCCPSFPYHSSTHFAIDSEDNVYWGGDQNVPFPRPSFQINDTLYALCPIHSSAIDS